MSGLIESYDLEIARLGFIMTKMTFSVLVGFTTQVGLNKIMSASHHIVKPTVLYGDILKEVRQMPGFKWLMTIGGIHQSCKPLVYFQHKMPDAMSVPYNLLVGRLYPDQDEGTRMSYITNCEDVEDCPPAWYRSPDSCPIP